MLLAAIIILAIAATGGLYMAWRVFSGQLAPWPLSIVHALAGATALVLLLLIVLEGGAPETVLWGLVLLAVAALGGFFLASFHLRDTLPPKAVVGIHGGVAVVGFLILLSALLT